MRKRLAIMTFLFAMGIVVVSGMLYLEACRQETGDVRAELVIDLNEIEQLAKNGEHQAVAEKVSGLQENVRDMQTATDEKQQILIMGGISIAFLVVIFSYVWFAILKPFEKMKKFAQKISQGDFDVPLNYERSNYFGEFTWSFDCMRREITKARASEREAIENNKTVIATLSHDIKTPISSIRAYAEGLEANLDATPQKRAKYLQVLMRKCDEVSKLTNDLFLHSLSDLKKLQITLEDVEISEFLEREVVELVGEQEDITFVPLDFTAMIRVDCNRLLQVLENLVNNARKYARSNIEIGCVQHINMVEIRVQDYGSGIPDEDMPFIFDKFYRGQNCQNEQGSGLGLYIVKYIVEQMKGQVRLENSSCGLTVSLCFPVKKV